jgi:hypothetical protein
MTQSPSAVCRRTSPSYDAAGNQTPLAASDETARLDRTNYADACVLHLPLKSAAS